MATEADEMKCRPTLILPYYYVTLVLALSFLRAIKPDYDPNATHTPNPPLAYIYRTLVEPDLVIHSSVVAPEDANRPDDSNHGTVWARSSPLRQPTGGRQPTSVNLHTEALFLRHI